MTNRLQEIRERWVRPELDWYQDMFHRWKTQPHLTTQDELDIAYLLARLEAADAHVITAKSLLAADEEYVPVGTPPSLKEHGLFQEGCPGFMVFSGAWEMDRKEWLADVDSEDKE